MLKKLFVLGIVLAISVTCFAELNELWLNKDVLASDGDGSQLTGIVVNHVVTQSVQFNLAGQVLGTATDNMLRDHGLTAFEWNGGVASIVSIRVWLTAEDTGANDARVSMNVNASEVGGLSTDGATLTWVSTTTITSPALVDGDDIEFTTDAGGSNNDAINLTVEFVVTQNAR